MDLIFKQFFKRNSSILRLFAVKTSLFLNALFPSQAISAEEVECQLFSFDVEAAEIVDQIDWGTPTAQGLLDRFVTLTPDSLGNPYVHLLVAFGHLSESDYELSLAHLELAGYIVARHKVCHERQLEELIFLTRREVILGLIAPSGSSWRVESLLSGLVLPEIGLDSGGFGSIEPCLTSWLGRLGTQTSDNFCE